MALPILAGWALVTAIITITAGTGYSLYQIRASVESVEEIFTSNDSTLNSIAFKAILGATAVWLVSKYI